MGVTGLITEDDKIEAWRGGLIDTADKNSIANQMLQLFDKFEFKIIIAPDGIEYILSDNPVLKVWDNNEWLPSGFYMPLTPKYCVYINTKNTTNNNNNVKYKNVGKYIIRNINYSLLENSFNIVGYKDNLRDLTSIISSKKQKQKLIKKINPPKHKDIVYYRVHREGPLKYGRQEL